MRSSGRSEDPLDGQFRYRRIAEERHHSAFEVRRVAPSDSFLIAKGDALLRPERPIHRQRRSRAVRSTRDGHSHGVVSTVFRGDNTDCCDRRVNACLHVLESMSRTHPRLRCEHEMDRDPEEPCRPGVLPLGNGEWPRPRTSRIRRCPSCGESEVVRCRRSTSPLVVCRPRPVLVATGTTVRSLRARSDACAPQRGSRSKAPGNSHECVGFPVGGAH